MTLKRGQTAQWWRVVVDAGGNVTSCKRVDALGTDDGGGVFYIQAIDETQAGREATARYAKAVRHKLKMLGIVPPQPVARVTKKRDRPVKQLKLASIPCAPLVTTVGVTPLPPPSKINTRLAVLVEVQEAWMNNPTLGQFSKWLNSQIDALQGKKSASG